MSYEPTTRVPSRRLAGRALRWFTAAAELPLLGAPLRRLMLSAAGIPAFRSIPCDDATIVVPPLPVAGDDVGWRARRGVPAGAAAAPTGAVGTAGGAPRPLPGTSAWFAAAYRRGEATPV